MISALKMMLTMFKDWYRTGLMQYIDADALTRADEVFTDVQLDPLPSSPPPPVEPPPVEPPPVTPPPVDPPGEPPPPVIDDPPTSKYNVPFTEEPDWSEYEDGDQAFGDWATPTVWIVVEAGKRPFLPTTVRYSLGIVRAGVLV
jgi:hypothetical protein